MTTDPVGANVAGPPAISARPPAGRAWRRWLWLPLLVLFLFAAVMGLRAGQWAEVDSWFNAICSACIGLTFH